jgi:translation initiation factor IF-2
VIAEGKISSLKRFTEDVTEVKTGFECGIGLENFDDFQNGDLIETYQKVREVRA